MVLMLLFSVSLFCAVMLCGQGEISPETPALTQRQKVILIPSDLCNDGKFAQLLKSSEKQEQTQLL